jgi:hypothetical protein
MMSGSSPFIIKLLGVFADMEQLVGPDFDEGLARLKRAAEAAP